MLISNIFLFQLLLRHTEPNVQLPMQKVYNINLPGPTGRHVEMNKIYEMALPGKNSTFTSNTLGERLKMLDWIRQILIKQNDGEDISLDSDGHNSLMSYFKFMNINPNYYSLIHKSPYKGSPFGLLVYNSCFPIQLDQQSQTIICAKDSIGINIRLYSLTYAEYYAYKFRHPLYKEYDVWRELIYYEFVKENIIRPKISPNFVTEYLFMNSPNKVIDFFSLKTNQLTQKQKLTKEYQRFLELNSLKTPTQVAVSLAITYPENAGKLVVTKLPDEVDPGLQCYSGNTLIVLTESPTHNLYQWASRIYRRDGIVQKMISTGFYDDPVWLSVLFQIVSGLCVMQKFGLYIRDMTIEDNIYIKDLQTTGQSSGYWKYVIDGIPYYIPNYGYLVLIDTNYKDIYSETNILEQGKRIYKIYANKLYGKKYDDNVLKKKVFQNYRSIVNTNAFTKDHTQNNVNRPPEEIMKLIDRMNSDGEEDLSKVIFNHFKMYLHNRCGTYLKKDTELPNIRDVKGSFKRGELVIEVIGSDSYKFAVYFADKGNGVSEICTKLTPESDDYVMKDVRIETLKQYAEGETVEQVYRGNPDTKLSEDELLETYVIN